MVEKAKTYRIDADNTKKAIDRMVEYIAETRIPVTEAQVINASINKAIKEITDDEIREYVEGKK